MPKFSPYFRLSAKSENRRCKRCTAWDTVKGFRRSEKHLLLGILASTRHRTKIRQQNCNDILVWYDESFWEIGHFIRRKDLRQEYAFTSTPSLTIFACGIVSCLLLWCIWTHWRSIKPGIQLSYPWWRFFIRRHAQSEKITLLFNNTRYPIFVDRNKEKRNRLKNTSFLEVVFSERKPERQHITNYRYFKPRTAFYLKWKKIFSKAFLTAWRCRVLQAVLLHSAATRQIFLVRARENGGKQQSFKFSSKKCARFELTFLWRKNGTKDPGFSRWFIQSGGGWRTF